MEMDLIELSVDIFKKELTKVFNREKTEGTYLSAEMFKTCEQRARAGVLDAMEQVVKRIGIDICKHRAADHDEDIQEELAYLQGKVDPEYQVSTMDFWNPG